LTLVAAALVVGLLVGRGRRSSSQPAVAADDRGDRPSAPVSKKPPALNENALLRARVAELTAEIEQVKAAQAKEQVAKKRDCLTSATSDCPFLDPTPEELREMARCGIVHIDVPNFDREPEAGEPLTAEQQRIEEARVAVGDRMRGELQAIYREAGLPQPMPGAIAELSEALEKIARPEQADVLRQIARERAGAAPPSAIEQQTLAQRFFRLRAGVGDRYESALAKHLGAERAHALRLETNGWPMRAVYTGVCEPPDPAQ
jgi:hypothetical protein